MNPLRRQFSELSVLGLGPTAQFVSSPKSNLVKGLKWNLEISVKFQGG